MKTLKFKKKPVVIEAVQFNYPEEAEDIAKWCNGDVGWGEDAQPGIIIQTIEGPMKASIGWWIIKGVEGEFYPCKDSVFRATYEQTW